MTGMMLTQSHRGLSRLRKHFTLVSGTEWLIHADGCFERLFDEYTCGPLVFVSVGLCKAKGSKEPMCEGSAGTVWGWWVRGVKMLLK